MYFASDPIQQQQMALMLLQYHRSNMNSLFPDLALPLRTPKPRKGRGRILRVARVAFWRWKRRWTLPAPDIRIDRLRPDAK